MCSSHEICARRKPRRAHETRHGRWRAFSLVELVIVVTIIGVLASIAVPRISGAATGANSAALQATLASVRKAIDIYYAEHGSYPGYDPSAKTPSGDWFFKQLTMYSDADGDTNATFSPTYKYGPYLRKPFPTNPTNDLTTVLVKPTPSAPDPAAGSYGWVAVLSHGYFGILATDADLEDVGIDDIDVKKGLKGGAVTL